MKTPDQGGDTLVAAALNPSLEDTKVRIIFDQVSDQVNESSQFLKSINQSIIFVALNPSLEDT